MRKFFDKTAPLPVAGGYLNQVSAKCTGSANGERCGKVLQAGFGLHVYFQFRYLRFEGFNLLGFGKGFQ